MPDFEMMKPPRTDFTDRIVSHFSATATATPSSVSSEARLGTTISTVSLVDKPQTTATHPYAGFLSTTDSLFLVDIGTEADENASRLIQAQAYINSLLDVISKLKATAVDQQNFVDAATKE